MSDIRSIHKVLIANRGEIAVRIIRTCKELNIGTVAVFSEADRTSLHVRMADEAYYIGPSPAAESYLLGNRILEVALDSGADAVHPGYGFLSESSAFARACAEAKIVFIGPTPEAIEAMGDKTSARALMQERGVPMAPGTTDAVQNVEEAASIADKIGYPVLIKAAAGGGGKGMRVVSTPDEFASSMELASNEAASAFGDGRVFIEKYIDRPRHIEFQILADNEGNTVHLFERECSIQRRHQKVIEEAPSSILTEETRTVMGEAATSAAKSCGYTGAGTVEFLLARDGSFYFMEMNTRLQVEHPVTEGITGIDLVEMQIRIAEGNRLPFEQDDLKISGHAIACRIYAEDPLNNFMPSPGVLLRHAPPSGFGVRLDSGVEEGSEISLFYDPMISKLTTWGPSRDECIARMRRALDEYNIAGLSTTIEFCRFVMSHEAFTSGKFSTHFVDTHYQPEANATAEAMAEGDDEMEAAIAIAAALYADSKQRPTPVPGPVDQAGFSAWRRNRALSD